MNGVMILNSTTINIFLFVMAIAFIGGIVFAARSSKKQADDGGRKNQ